MGKVYIIGHTHIDAAWLWRRNETVDICKNSFIKVLKLLDKYPQFKFVQSSAQYYEWMEKKFPEIFEKIKTNVRRGKWEPTLPWVEFDANIPSGESLVRQIIYAKIYFREKFGYDPKILWLPDTFGFPITLPQIMVGCGVKYFFTQKLRWNDTIMYPFYCFWWESPDGSRVLAYQTPGSYSGTVSKGSIEREMNLSMFKQGIDVIYHLIGYGDHGGGVEERMIKDALKFFEEKTHKASFALPIEFFRELEKIALRKRLPLWRDELYLQYHRGTYTTQARIKRLLRNAERLLIESEKLASLASMNGFRYPFLRLRELWSKLLFNQFHDIAAGSSIPEVYEDALKDIKEVAEGAGLIIADSLNYLLKGVGVEKDSIVVFNTLSWRRSEVVEIESYNFEAGSLEAGDGRLIPIQKTERGKIVFIAEDLPSLGYKVFKPSKRILEGLSGVKVTENGDMIVMENDIIKAEVDRKRGVLVGLYLKGSRFNLIDRSKGATLQIFDDTPVVGRQTLEERLDAKIFDAWEIYIFQQPGGIRKKDLISPLEINVRERGPIRGIVDVKYIYKQEERRDSLFEVRYCIYSGIPWLDIRIKVNWNAKHKMLKFYIPVSFGTEYVKFDQPYGWVSRRNPLSPNATLSERAKWEVPGQMWAEIRDEERGCGISILDRGVYGYDFGNNYIRLSLLRSAEYPPPYSGERQKEEITDQGNHEFNIAIYPHGRSYKLIDTVRRAYEYNYPALPMILKRREGKPLHECSYLSVRGDIVLTVLKRCEKKENHYVLRLHEPEGIEKLVELSFAEKEVREAFTADFMEENLKEIDVHHNRIKIAIPKFKVVTIIFY